MLEAIGVEFSEMRQEVRQQIGDVNRHLEIIDRRLDRISETNSALQTQLGALTRWADRLDKDNSQVNSVQAAQQREIESLAARIAKLEARLQQA